MISPRPLLIDFNDHPNAPANQRSLEAKYEEANASEKISIEIRHGGDQFYFSKALRWFKARL